MGYQTTTLGTTPNQKPPSHMTLDHTQQTHKPRHTQGQAYKFQNGGINHLVKHDFIRGALTDDTLTRDLTNYGQLGIIIRHLHKGYDQL